MTKRHRSIIAGFLGAAILTVVVVWLLCLGPTLYTATILPSLGGDFTMADAINDRGQVVGTSSLPGGSRRLFLWDCSGGMRDLGPIDGPADINNKGQICGTVMDPNGWRRAFLLDPDGSRRWLGTLGGSTSIAMAINNHGQIVGESWTAEELQTGVDVSHAFLWDETQGMRDLRPPGADRSYALAINDHSKVMVFRPQEKVLLWDPERGFLNAHEPKPGDLFGFGQINNRGRMALPTRFSTGRSQVRMSSGVSRWQTLVELRGDIGEVRLNDVNQVLFTKVPRAPRIPLLNRLFGRRAGSYIWDPSRGLVPLDGYVPHGSDMRLVVRDLNNNGCVVGDLFSRTGKHRLAVLLEPIPARWGR